jgi:hypothetical protein
VLISGVDELYIQSSRGVVVIFLCRIWLFEYIMVLFKCFDHETSMLLSICGYKIWIVKHARSKAIYCSFQRAFELFFSSIIDNSKEVSSLSCSFVGSLHITDIIAISLMLKSETDSELKEQPEPVYLPLKYNRCVMILAENIIIVSSSANQLVDCHWVNLHSSAGPLPISRTSILKKESQLIMKMLSNEVAYNYMINLCMMKRKASILHDNKHDCLMLWNHDGAVLRLLEDESDVKTGGGGACSGA